MVEIKSIGVMGAGQMGSGIAQESGEAGSVAAVIAAAHDHDLTATFLDSIFHGFAKFNGVINTTQNGCSLRIINGTIGIWSPIVIVPAPACAFKPKVMESAPPAPLPP